MKKRVFLLLSLGLLFFGLYPRLSAQDSGVFLKFPISPRAAGMGDSYAAQAGDPLGIYYNPAAIAFTKTVTISAAYHKYFQDIDGNTIALVLPFNSFAIGSALTVFKMAEEPIYDSQGVDTGESYGYESKIIPIAAAARFGRLALGFSAKSYSEYLGGIKSETLACDVGAIYHLNWLWLGGSIQNYGGRIFGYDVAKAYRIGAAYTASKFTLLADYKKETEVDGSLSVGGEVSLSESLLLRGGWRFKDSFGGLSSGLGIKLGRGLSFDYALLSYGDLGLTHKAGLSIAFQPSDGRPKTKKVAKPKPVQPPPEKPFINSAPTLTWTGEEGFESVGISTGLGNMDTVFVYRVRYLDVDGNSPAYGYPKVHIARSEWEIMGSPFIMEFVSGNNKTGAVYSYSQTLTPGNDYSYFFDSKDSQGAIASGVSVAHMPGPVVSRLETRIILGGTNVAVIEFTGKNVSQGDASIATDFVRAELVKTGLFNVMDRNNMEAILTEQKFQNSGCTEQQCAVEIGKLLSVRQMLQGSLSKLGETYFITLDVIDVESGKIVATYDSEATSTREIKEACRTLAKKISQ